MGLAAEYRTSNGSSGASSVCNSRKWLRAGSNRNPPSRIRRRSQNLLSFFCQEWPFHSSVNTMSPDAGNHVNPCTTRHSSIISMSGQRQPSCRKLDSKSSEVHPSCGFESHLRQLNSQALTANCCKCFLTSLGWGIDRSQLRMDPDHLVVLSCDCGTTAVSWDGENCQ